jgi:hypothetical protein
MKPMKPMAPMAPMKPIERWWPDHFGEPASVGSQNDLRYAFFRDKRRLVVDRGDSLVIYDTGDHDIGGVAQASGELPSVEFTSQRGLISLGELSVVG